jgi:hypothetical protein
MNTRRILRAASWVVAVGISQAALGALVGPTPYTGFADSPFNGVDFSAGYFHREDFEDALLNVPGVTASAGAPFAPGGITDSVDEDDGAIDGSGTAGNSFFSGSGSTGITFTFDEATLGSLPTHAGVVWTDGSGTISFEAFDKNGASLGTIGPFSEAGSPDDNFNGGTSEDRFFGFADATEGISKIFISNTAGGIEVDHLQFGAGEAVSPPPPPPPPPPGGGAIPLPAPIWAGMAMFATAGAAYRRITRRAMDRG